MAFLLTLCVLAIAHAEAAPHDRARTRGNARQGGAALRIQASSSDTRDGQKMGPEQAFDADLATAWVEGVPGSGKGEWLQIDFGAYRSIASVTLFGGNYERRAAFSANNHLEAAELQLTTRDGQQTLPLRFLDRPEPLTVPVGLEVRRVRLVIDRAYAGELASETMVAEVAFNLNLKDPSVVAQIDAWKQSREGEAELNATRAKLEAARKKVDAGDLHALSPLLDAVRRGLEPTRARLARALPPGFVMAYLEPDAPSLEALKELRLPEPVPALEQATWIADEADAVYLQRLAGFLTACGELRRPPRRGLPPWGTSGIEPGALQGRREPLPIAVDRAGAIYVADVGNNRVQRFSDEGRLEHLSGAGEAGIEERFMEQQVPYYVAGSRAGTGPGEYVQPLAITVVRHWREEYIAVIDAARRLQLLDRDLTPLRSWTVPSEAPLLPGVGIAGPALVGLKGRLFVLWGREGFVYDLEGRLKRKLELEGSVRSAIGYRGRLLVNFEGGVVRRYGADGLRYGTFLEIPESDPAEEIDLAAGPDGLLYVHSDTGALYRFERRGRLEASLETVKAPGQGMRLAVGAETVYLTSGDRILAFPLP